MGLGALIEDMLITVPFLGIIPLANTWVGISVPITFKPKTAQILPAKGQKR